MTLIITFIINTTRSLTIVRLIIQLEHNSVYHKIFILIHNLITHTTLYTNHPKYNKNTITISKYPPKRPDNGSNQITIICHRVTMKPPKKLQQQPCQKTEVMKVNTIMEQLNEWYGNGHRSKININNFAPLFGSDNV